jgi:hypothetical protein
MSLYYIYYIGHFRDDAREALPSTIPSHGIYEPSSLLPVYSISCILVKLLQLFRSGIYCAATNPYLSTQFPELFNSILSGHFAISGGHCCELLDFQSKIATVPTEIINAITAKIKTIFWMERLKKLLNIPLLPLPLPLPLAPDDAVALDDEPNAEEPMFLAPEIKSILSIYNKYK